MKLISAVSTALLLGAVMPSLASAQGVYSDVEVRTGVSATGVLPAVSTEGTAAADARGANAAVGVQVGVGVTSTGTPERGNATSTAARDNANAEGKITAEAHMSRVAAFVRSLLAVANREGGIGAEVRAVAQSQQDSASTSVRAIANVEGRGWLRTILFGSDYRSLGQLRSEIAVTAANITQLKNLLGRTVIEADRVELSAQITALETLQAETEAFVEARENSFSLFGWLAKRFAQ